MILEHVQVFTTSSCPQPHEPCMSPPTNKVLIFFENIFLTLSFRDLYHKSAHCSQTAKLPYPQEFVPVF